MTDLKAAKALLGKKNLVGFLKADGGHKMLRASSAKVTTVETLERKEPVALDPAKVTRG